MTTPRDAHPDEGTIHAWLDRQLDATSTATLEAHLQGCDECAERVAEARGLIAGTSRILVSLDDERVPSTPMLRAEPSEPAPAPAAAPSRWRALRVTPRRAAIAATIIVAAGLVLTHERTGVDLPPPAPVASSQRSEAATQLRAPVVPPRDHLLDSAVARNLAKAQPPRAVEPSPVERVAARPAISAPPMAAEVARIDSTSATRVAAARGAAESRRDSTVGADLARVARLPAAKSAPTEEVIAAAKVADQAVRAFGARIAGGVAAGAANVEATQCFRVESASGTAATWGPVALPLVIALDAPASRSLARVLTAAGAETGTGAVWKRAPNDSLLFTLRRIGFSGSLVLGEPGPVRAGVMRSSQSMMRLESVGVTSADSPALPVVARPISCPSPDAPR